MIDTLEKNRVACLSQIMNSKAVKRLFKPFKLWQNLNKQNKARVSLFYISNVIIWLEEGFYS